MLGKIMKYFRPCALFLTFTMIFFSCDSNIMVAQKSSNYDPRIHLSEVGMNEQLPAGVRNFLNQKPGANKFVPKFPLSYYLIQEDDVKFIRTKNFNPEIVAQLDSEVSGERYFKLFVHPDVDTIYSFLKRGYRYISSSVCNGQTTFYWYSG